MREVARVCRYLNACFLDMKRVGVSEMMRTQQKKEELKVFKEHGGAFEGCCEYTLSLSLFHSLLQTSCVVMLADRKHKSMLFIIAHKYAETHRQCLTL